MRSVLWGIPVLQTRALWRNRAAITVLVISVSHLTAAPATGQSMSNMPGRAHQQHGDAPAQRQPQPASSRPGMSQQEQQPGTAPATTPGEEHAGHDMGEMR